MSHIIRSITSCAILAINRTPINTVRIVRTVFSNAALSLDSFKVAREQYVARHASSLDAFKKRLVESINKPGEQIFTEDLRNMILSVDTDEEIDHVIQALRKYKSNKLKISDFHFGSPIMRLLYVKNKTDLAMQLFMDESLNDIFSDAGSALILLNKLVEDKRYDDAVKVFEFGMKRGFSTASGRKYPSDAVTLAIEALYKQNTKQSLEKAKQLVGKIIEGDSDINPRAAVMVALLSVQNNEPSFAMEILAGVRSQGLTTIQNIRAMCYAEMGRIEEAINIVHLLADQPPIGDDRRRVFPIVLKYIEKAIEKSKDVEIKKRFEDLSKFISTNNRLSIIDLSTFIDEPIVRHQAIANPRVGVKQAPSGGFQRTSESMRDRGYKRDFNDRPKNFKQGFSSNKFQSSRPGGNAYVRNERQ